MEHPRRLRTLVNTLVNTHIHTRAHQSRMGNEQSSTDHTESVKAVDGDIEAPATAVAVVEGPSVVDSKPHKCEACTQTDAVEEGGYDMRAPRRKRKLFGVVAVVGEKGESSVLPSADEQRQSYCLLALVEYLRRLVRRACGCSWLNKI